MNMTDDADAMHGIDLLGMALGRGLPGSDGADLDEFVDFQIFFDGAAKATQAGEAVPFLRARMCDCFEVFSACGLDKYLWHCDRLLLEIELGSNDEEPHLTGHVRTGDGAEDEWFVTFLLQKLTSARPDTSCRVVDADGELIVIEAALAAPRWLTPASAENRAWLRSGKVHILPKPRPPEPEQISSSEALARLRKAGDATVAKDKVQNVINQRLEGYPKRALELSTHVVRAVLPVPVAKALIAFPQLVSVALDNLPPPATQELGRLRKSLAGSGASLRFDCDSLSEKEMACIGVRLSRCQYARLMGLRIQLPQRFTQKNWKTATGSSQKACRLGAMLCCGLDAAYLQDFQSAVPALRWPSSLLSDSALPQSVPWCSDAAFAKHAAAISPPLKCDSLAARRAFEQQRGLEEDFRPSLLEVIKSDVVQNIDVAKHWRDDDDPEGWLEISGEELDQEMKRRQDEFDRYDRRRESKSTSEAAGRAEAAANGAMPEKLREELASMGKEISGLLERASCLEGVEASSGNAPATSSTRSTEDCDDSDSEGSDEIDVLGMEDGNENLSGSEDEEEQDEHCSAEEMHKYMAELDEQLEEQEGFGESAPEGTPGDDGLPLSSHHIKVSHDASAPLELDLHAMEHLLASYCAEHHFEPGPASLLLGELGLAGNGRDMPAAASLDSMD